MLPVEMIPFWITGTIKRHHSVLQIQSNAYFLGFAILCQDRYTQSCHDGTIFTNSHISCSYTINTQLPERIRAGLRRE